MKSYTLLLPIFLLGFYASSCMAQQPDPGRRALWEATFSRPGGPGPGASITHLDQGSPLEKSGFLTGDILISVGGTFIRDAEVWSQVYDGLKSGVPVPVEAVRGARAVRADVVFNPRPKESHPTVDTFYESVTSTYGITHRTIITKPKSRGRQPAIMILDGLSCSSIEVYPGRDDNWGKTLSDIVEKSGMVVMRVEKAGVGDSEGNCGQTDFYMDLAGYEAALLSLKAKPYVDPARVVVYGSSMGSALAPYIANTFDLAGIISDGTFYKTWYEHMLEIERRIRQFEGDTESEIVQKMNRYYIPLYYGMLIEQKSYKEVVERYPALAAFNYHGDAHMYGRPMEYYHQLQRFDLAGAWEKVKVPVRILRGSNDWIMSAEDNHMIIEVLERHGHQDHELLIYPGLDHWNTIHRSAKDSYSGNPGQWDGAMVDQIIRWAREMVALKG